MRLPELYAAAPNSDQDWKSRIAERQLEDTELARDPRILQLKLKVLQALRANERPALPPAAASRIEKIRSKIKAHVLPLGKRHAIADSTCPALSR